ncbi:NAD-dependent malic enzyme 59 kDa isoform [Spatholobus suberectus]|nr:NAD-dependent malic enzyme 59 kDa isoform [Spatholobus suberectus]
MYCFLERRRDLLELERRRALLKLERKKVAPLPQSPSPLRLQVALCIRNVTTEVGAAVLLAAIAEEQAEGHHDVGFKELAHVSKDTVEYV